MPDAVGTKIKKIFIFVELGLGLLSSLVATLVVRVHSRSTRVLVEYLQVGSM